MKALKEFNGHRAAFAFRIDTDFFHPEHVKKTLEVAEKHGIKMTWFTSMETGQFHKQDIKRIAETQDVQNHAFEHETFEDEEKNFQNIMKADSMLKEIGIECNGFASPFGKWNQGLAMALERTGYLYSSEFREGRNVFPFYPAIGGKKANVLQVPVHPVSFGNLLESGYSVQESMDYFDKIIDLLYVEQVPIFLYCHPAGRLGKYPRVLDGIFAKIKELDDVWFTNLTEYADFWKKKGLNGRETGFDSHFAFFEKRDSVVRRAIMFHRGQVMRVSMKKIKRRFHK
jgi:peptidoglycan/xylan/chitin deacetylase (PgdA/CDA1 family)